MSATDAPRRPVRIGVQIAPQHGSYTQIRDTVAEIEEDRKSVV